MANTTTTGTSDPAGLFDVSLEHWPTIRIPAQDENDAIAEYKRLYGIDRSHHPFVAVKADPGSPAPVEPESWIAIRKSYGTHGTERKSVPPSAPETPPSPPAADKPPSTTPTK